MGPTDDAHPADGAARPAAVTHQAHGVLGDEHPWSASQPRPFPDRVATGSPGRLRTGDAECSRVAQRARVAPAFALERLGIRDAVGAIQLEGDRVEVQAVMGDATATAARLRSEPVRQLVQEREPLVELIGSRGHRYRSRGLARDAGGR